MSACVNVIARFVIIHGAAAQVKSPQSYPFPGCGKLFVSFMRQCLLFRSV